MNRGEVEKVSPAMRRKMGRVVGDVGGGALLVYDEHDTYVPSILVPFRKEPTCPATALGTTSFKLNTTIVRSSK